VKKPGFDSVVETALLRALYEAVARPSIGFPHVGLGGAVR